MRAPKAVITYYVLLITFVGTIFIWLETPYVWAFRRYNTPEGIYWQTIRQMFEGRKLYSEIYCSQFPLFIEWLRLSLLVNAPEIFTARVLILFWGPIAALAAFFLARTFLNPVRAGLIATLLLFNPLFFSLAHQVSGEIPGLAFVLLAALALRKDRPQTAALLFVLAIQFKPVMFLATPTLLWLIPARTWRVQFLARVAFGTAAILAWYGWFQAHGFGQIQGGLFAHFWTTPPHFLRYFAENLRAAAGEGDYIPSFFVLVLPLLVYGGYLVRSRFPEWRLPFRWHVLTLGLPLFFYVVINPDHLILFVPIALYLASRRRELAGVVLLVSLYFIFSQPADSDRPSKAFRRAREALRNVTGSGDEVMGNDAFLITASGRLMPARLLELTPARVMSHSLTCDEVEAAMKNQKITALVWRDRPLDSLPCEDTNLPTLTNKYFPREIFDTEKMTIYARD